MSISVVIPVKNRLEKLREALASALQIDKISEIIVVDDHSVPSIQRGMLGIEDHAERVKIIRNSGPGGAQHARSLGFSAAAGDIILFLDSDDLLIASGISDLVDAATTHTQASLFYGNLDVFGTPTDFLQLRGHQYPRLLKNLSLCPFSGLMVRKSAASWENVSKDLPAWQDDDFCLNVAKAAQVHFVDTLTAEYRPSSDSISASVDKRLSGLRIMIDKWGPEMRRVVGLRCVMVWKLMYYALWAESRIAARKIEGRSRKTPGAILLKTTSKWARSIGRSYLDKLYV